MLKNYSLRQWVTPWCRLALAAALTSGSYAAHALAGPRAAEHHAPAAKPLAANDAAVTVIYSYGRLASPLGLPHAVQAVVTNAGTAALTNLPVTLNVTGSNSFTDTQPVASLAPGASATVTFAAYPNTLNLGGNILTVTVPADDNSGNNSATFTQRITASRVSYIDTTQAYNSNGATVGGANGVIAAKYTLSSAFNYLSGVTATFATTSSTTTSYQVVIYDANGVGGIPGNLLYTSTTRTHGAASSSATVPVPNIQVGSTFFVGLKEIDNGLGVATQPESPLRPNTFYVLPPGGTWTPIASSTRRAIDIVLSSTAPACPVPTAITVTPSFNSASVAFTAPSAGTSYQLIYVLAGTTPTASSPTLTTTSSPAVITGLASNTSYDVYIRGACGTATSITSGPFNFRTACPPVSFPYTETFDGVTAPNLPCGITVLDANADTKTWANTSGTASSTPNAMRYTFGGVDADDWFFTPSLPLVVGKSYQVEFKYRANSAAFPEGLEVKVGTSTSPGSQTTTLFSNTSITNITYATTVAGGVAGQVLLFTPTTAGSYNFGFHAISAASQSILFVDDVKITQIDTPPCLAPTAPVVSGITAASATVAFTAPAAGTSYTLIYVPRGTTPTASSPSVSGTASPITITGLTQNTSYDVYVQATCGTTGTSTLTGPVTFTTSCLPTTVFPYTENFDGVTAPTLPCGVRVLDVNADGKTWANTTGISAASTPNAMRYTFSGTNAADDWFFTNGLNMVVGKSYQLEFKYRSTTTTGEGLEVKVGTGNTVAGQTTTVFSNPNIINTTYTTSVAGTINGQVVLFTPTTAGTYYFGFHAISAANKAYLDVDDVRVTEATPPACPAPTGLAVGNLTSTGATVTFTAPAAGTSYAIVYVPRGTTPTASSPSVSGTASPIVLTSLNSNASYDVYVRATCGTAGTSTLTGPVTFTTLCANNAGLPYSENFDGVTAPALPCGIVVLDVNNDGKTWANSTSAPAPASTPNAMRYTYSTANAANDWFFTSGLSLQAGGTYQLEFKYKGASTFFAEGLEVKVGPSNTVAGQTTTVFSNTNILTTTYTTTTPGTVAAGGVLSFTPSTTGTYYFGFHAISAADEFYLDVDDVKVTATGSATCPTPTALAVSNVTTSTATVTFSGPTAGTSYKVIYVPTGTTPTAASPSVTVTASPATITGLAQNQKYDVYVQATCGTAGASTQAGPVSFTTPCQLLTQFPYLQSFDNTTAPALPCGITTLDANADGNVWSLVAVNPSSSPNAMRYAGGFASADDWFFTEALPMKPGFRYQLQFKYRAGTYTEKMEVKIGTAPTIAAQNTSLYLNTRITNTSYTTTTAGSATDQVASFTPTANGNYYIGFHAISAGSALYIYVDDVEVTETIVTSTKSNVAAGFRAEASPVPFGSSLTLSLNTLKAGPLQLTLLDAVGRTVRQTTATVPTGASSLDVPEVGSLPAGIYLLKVQQGGNTQVIRVAHE